MRTIDEHSHRLSRRAFLQNGTLFLAATATVGASSLFADEGKDRLRVGLITDLHHADKPPAGTRHYRETLGKLAEAAIQFEKDKVNFVVELGDLIDAADTVETEQRYLTTINREFAAISKDRHYVLGNHCVDTLTKAEFLDGVEQKQSYYSFDRGDFHFVVLGRDDGKNTCEFTPIFFRKDRYEVVEKSTFWLSPTPDKTASKGWDAALPRIASWVKLMDRQTGTIFYVMNTHFDHRGTQARAESAALLLKHLRENFVDHPVILTGDLNTTPDSVPYNTLIGKGTQTSPVYLDAYEHSVQKRKGPDSTWNGFEAIVPHRRIDFVFTTKSVRVERFQTLDDQRESRFPSDHLPVVAELELMKE